MVSPAHCLQQAACHHQSATQRAEPYWRMRSRDRAERCFYAIVSLVDFAKAGTDALKWPFSRLLQRCPVSSDPRAPPW